MKAKIDWERMYNDLCRAREDIYKDIRAEKVKPDRLKVRKKPPRICVTFHLDELDWVRDDLSLEGEEKHRQILERLEGRVRKTREIMKKNGLKSYGSRFFDFKREEIPTGVVLAYGYDKKNYKVPFSR